MSGRRLRQVQRGVHLGMGLVTAVAVYVPLPEAASALVRWVALPVLLLSGVAMWQAPKLRRVARTLRQHVTPPHRANGQLGAEAQRGRAA